MDFWILLSTVPSRQEGRKIARALVKERLVGCVNLVPGLESFFRWEGKICLEKEALLIAKTGRGKLGKIKKKLKEIHPYEVPEIIFLKIGGGEKDYLNWVKEVIGE